MSELKLLDTYVKQAQDAVKPSLRKVCRCIGGCLEHAASVDNADVENLESLVAYKERVQSTAAHLDDVTSICRDHESRIEKVLYEKNEFLKKAKLIEECGTTLKMLEDLSEKIKK